MTASMEALLGMRLEDARPILKDAGVPYRVVTTAAPRTQREGGTLRIIRVRESEITLGAFQDQPREETACPGGSGGNVP